MRFATSHFSDGGRQDWRAMKPSGPKNRLYLNESDQSLLADFNPGQLPRKQSLEDGSPGSVMFAR